MGRRRYRANRGPRQRCNDLVTSYDCDARINSSVVPFPLVEEGIFTLVSFDVTLPKIVRACQHLTDVSLKAVGPALASHAVRIAHPHSIENCN